MRLKEQKDLLSGVLVLLLCFLGRRLSTVLTDNMWTMRWSVLMDVLMGELTADSLFRCFDRHVQHEVASAEGNRLWSAPPALAQNRAM